MDIRYKVTFTSTYKGATLESREYEPHGNFAVVATLGTVYLGSYSQVSQAKAGVTRHLKHAAERARRQEQGT